MLKSQMGVEKMIERAKFNQMEEIVDLKLEMFRESGHLPLLADDAKQIILQKYTELYQLDDAAHFIVNQGDKVIACGGGFIKSDLPYCFYKQPFYGFIGDVYTIPGERGKGLGTALTKAVIAWLQQKGVTTIRLLAYEQGRPIYEKMGFSATEEMALILE